jgi:hypothetical protein
MLRPLFSTSMCSLRVDGANLLRGELDVSDGIAGGVETVRQGF